jgi:hypothetical protein
MAVWRHIFPTLDTSVDEFFVSRSGERAFSEQAAPIDRDQFLSQAAELAGNFPDRLRTPVQAGSFQNLQKWLGGNRSGGPRGGQGFPVIKESLIPLAENQLHSGLTAAVPLAPPLLPAFAGRCPKSLPMIHPRPQDQNSEQQGEPQKRKRQTP